MFFLVPGLSALFMSLMLGWELFISKEDNRKPMVYLFCCMMAWVVAFFLPLFYFFVPSIHLYLNWLFYGAILIRPVLFYHFIFEITRTSTDKHFSYTHYIIPAIVVLLAFILLFVVPYEDQMRVIVSQGRFSDEQSFYGMFFNSKAFLKLLFDIFYLYLCFASLRRYHKFIINYASNERKSSLRWMHWYLWILIFPLCSSILLLVLPRSAFLTSPLVASPLFMMAFLMIYIVYHTLKRQYIIPVIDDTNNDEPSYYDNSGTLKKSLLTREYFEEYINKRCPHLNPDLKITDLVNDLQVNRTYISGFINREYDMNFSRFINQCRLNEYQRMLSDPALKDKSKEELIILAGFSSYRYFRKLEKELA